MAGVSNGPAFAVGAWLQQDAHHPAGPSESAHISKPVELTHWTKTSKNEGGEYLNGADLGLGTYTPPQLPADLNAGFASFIKKDESEATPVETIVRAVLDAPDASMLQRAHVITFRNNLNKIFSTPFALNKAWKVDACLVDTQGSKLLCLDIVKMDETAYPNMERFVYYGYHFEALCTSSPHPVDATSEYASVLMLRLGALRVLMAAEIDACMLRDPDNPVDSYVELKTVVQPQNDMAMQRMVKDKFPRFWVQSFLAGVPKIVVGERNKQGQLLEVKELDVARIPAVAASFGVPFDAHQLLRFGEAVLAWMHAFCAQREGQHVHFTYDPASSHIHAQVDHGGELPQRLAALLGAEEAY